MAEFHEPEKLLEAAQKANDAGYTQMDAYTPFPVEGLTEALGFKRPKLPLLVLIGGIIGAMAGYGLQYYTSAIAYPLNVGGRPLNSVISFIPVTFEVTILFAALTAVFGMLALNRLPMPYHPVFNVPSFQLASQDKFFLCIEARDPIYDKEKTRSFMESIGADQVNDVEH